jgi:SAM-dependent methyltransferase
MADMISLETFYDDYPRHEAAFQERLDESLQPRGPEDLYKLVGDLALPQGAAVVDVGCGEGEKAIELARRFEVQVLAIDPVGRHLELGRSALAQAAGEDLSQRVRFGPGRAEAIPVDDATVDLIWCCEVLMHADLDRAFGEFHRVLRDGGWALVYQVLSGAGMTDDEANAFWTQFAAAASSVRPSDLDQAIAGAGLFVRQRVEYRSEWGERAEESTGAGTRRLLHTSRLLREPDRYKSQFGDVAYQIMLGDCLWHVYRMIGKLGGWAYLIQKEPT